MPPRLRLLYSGLTLIALIFPAVVIYSDLATRPDIWWTPLPMAATPGESRDRIEIYVDGKPLAARVAAQQLWLRDELGSRALSGDQVRLRFNNWDRVRVSRMPLLLLYAAVFGGGLVALLVIATGRLVYRGEREPVAS